MMRTTSKILKSLAVLSAFLPFCTSGLASIVYDNSFNDLNKTAVVANGQEIGDEITLSGTDRIVNDFKFEYFLSGNASGNETLQLFIRQNDGPTVSRTLPDNTTISVPTPGTVLYTSPVLTLGTGIQTAEAKEFEITVPDSFTWSVVFSGIDAGEVAGLRIYSPPTTGSSFSDFWEKSGGTWSLSVYPDGTPGNFAARVSAVPEPTTIAYALLAGLSCVGYLGLKRRS